VAQLALRRVGPAVALIHKEASHRRNRRLS